MQLDVRQVDLGHGLHDLLKSSCWVVPYAFSMLSRIEPSEATTGSMLKPVMNLISVQANTFGRIDHGDGQRSPTLLRADL